MISGWRIERPRQERTYRDWVERFTDRTSAGQRQRLRMMSSE